VTNAFPTIRENNIKTILSLFAAAALVFAAQASAADPSAPASAKAKRGIMNAKMDEGARRKALKKLFAEAHFSESDGLDSEFVDRRQPEQREVRPLLAQRAGSVSRMP
jgi:hypothetical protein